MTTIILLTFLKSSSTSRPPNTEKKIGDRTMINLLRRLDVMKLKSQLTILLSIIAIVLLSSIIIYYTFIRDILIKKETLYNNNVLLQVSDKVSSISSETKKFTEILTYNNWTNGLLKSDEPLSKYNYFNMLSIIVSNIAIYNPNVKNIVLADKEMNLVGFNSRYMQTVDYLDKNYHFSTPGINNSLFTGRIPQEYNVGDSYCYIQSVIEYGSDSKVGSKLGTYLVFCSIQPLESMLQQISITENSTFLILDSKNELVAGTDNLKDKVNSSKIIGELNRYFSSLNDKPQSVNLLNKDNLVMSYQLSQTGWKVVGIVPIKKITADLDFLLLISIIFSMVMFLAISLMGRQISHSISRPIEKIVLFIGKGANFDMRNRLSLNEENEIGQISRHINRLLDEIDSIMRISFYNQTRMYEAEISKHRAEFAALQSQINPHFLYNALNCIKGYGHILGSNEIVKITTALSSIMRYSIKGPEEVEIKEEIKQIRRYLDIISIRYPGKYQITYNLSEDILHCVMLRFLLQPIVENAVYHGLEPNNENGFLIINGFCDQYNMICFEVIDNGVGLTSDKKAELDNGFQNICTSNILTSNSDKSIGLLNIAQRIKLKYGNQYGVSISNNAGGGTTVTIKLPTIFRDMEKPEIN